MATINISLNYHKKENEGTTIHAEMQTIEGIDEYVFFCGCGKECGNEAEVMKHWDNRECMFWKTYFPKKLYTKNH